MNKRIAVLLVVVVLISPLCIEVRKEETGFVRIFTEYDDLGGIMSGDKVVGVGRYKNESRVMVYNLTTKEEEVIHKEKERRDPNYIIEISPYLLDISGDLVAWVRTINAFTIKEPLPEEPTIEDIASAEVEIESKDDIFLYNLSSHKKEILYKDSPYPIENLRLERDKIIWMEREKNYYLYKAIHLYDLKHGEEQLIFPKSIDINDICEIELYKEWILIKSLQGASTERTLSWHRYNIRTEEVEKLLDGISSWTSSREGVILYSENDTILGCGVENKTKLLLYKSSSIKSPTQFLKEGDLLLWINNGGDVVHYADLKTQKEGILYPPEGLMNQLSAGDSVMFMLSGIVGVYKNKVIINFGPFMCIYTLE